MSRTRSTYEYRDCPCCGKGKIIFTLEGHKARRPVVSLLVLVSTVCAETRQQKSSGSQVMCADCLAAILDGKPLPLKLRDGIAAACKNMGVEVQRALPLKVAKPRKAAR